MKKFILSAVLVAAAAVPAMAGGLLTNTNQNAAFLRQMSQDGTIDITGLYANPAGTAFLNNGWHLSLNIQTAFQNRDIETSFKPFELNTNNPDPKHSFHGHASAPAIPSFQLSYNHDKWSVNASFAIGGGGGKCEFENGLGTFEALYASQIVPMLPTIQAGVNAGFASQLPDFLAKGLMTANHTLTQEQATAAGTALAGTATYDAQMKGYSMDAYMRGRNYVFGLTLGGTYKFLDNLAGYVGVRMQYATNSYMGYVKNVAAQYTINYNVPANAAMDFPGTNGNVDGQYDITGSDIDLDCDQTGFSAAPIIGLDYKLNDQWNFAIKYEAPTIMKLKNSTKMNPYAEGLAASNPTIGQFKDGEKVREDIPGILTLGVQYSPIQTVRVMAGFHEYFDKGAKKYGDKQDLIDHNTWELNAGAEWDLCKWVTLSGSWQTTQYGLSDAYMNDLSFNLSNHMIGVGVRVNAAKWCTVDLGYMHTFYQNRTVTTPTNTAAGNKVDTYSRTNDVFGVGVNLTF